MPEVSVIILNFNGKKYLSECFDSLRNQTCPSYEVILVDNGSSDGSVEFVGRNYPWVHVLPLDRNCGFAEGNNRGLEVARGKYIVTLNNDTKAESKLLESLVVEARASDSIGMVATKMLNYFESGKIDSAGIKISTDGMSFNIGYDETDTGQYDKDRDVFGPCAGAALYKRDMLDDVGFFDDDFFAYYEDVDLAWRSRLMGWKCVFAPDAIVYHVHSATGGKGSAFKVFHIHRNRWFVIIKNWPLRVLLRNLPRLFFTDISSFLLALLRGRGGAAFMARYDLIKALPKLVKKRRSIACKADSVESFFSSGVSYLSIIKRHFS